MSDEREQIAEVAILVAELHETLGLPSLKELGTWSYQWNDEKAGWGIAANGKHAEQEITCQNWPVKLKPFHMAAFRNGWLLGLFSAFGGTFMGENGKGEDQFIEAIQKKIAKEKTMKSTVA